METVPFDWCSFFSLFWNDKGIKCKVNIPDTVLFRYGQLSAWWSTNKESCIQRHTSQSTSIEAIRKRFLSVAQQDDSNYSKFVSISWLGSGKPQLLRVMAFNQLCELLSDRLESGRPDTTPDVETPAVLQAFIQPWQDLRYVTTYINNGTSVTCHTFQRKYSRRYTPMSAATAAQLDSRDADIIMSVGPDADARRAEIESHQGVVEPSLKMQLRKLTAHIVKYIQRAHGLTLGGIVCEYIRDADGKVYLMSVLRTEWVSNAAGNGSGSLSAAALQAPVRELPIDEYAAAPEASQQNTGDQDDVQHDDASEDGFDDDFGAEHVSKPPGSGLVQQQPPQLYQGSPELGIPSPLHRTQARPTTARPASRGPADSRSQLAQYPGGQGRLTNLPLSVANTWPSHQHEASLAPGSPTSTIPVITTSITEAGALSSSVSRVCTSQGGGRSKPGGPSLVPTAPRSVTRPSSSPTARPASWTRSTSPARTAAPGGAPLGFGSTTHRVSHASPDRPYSARGVGAAPAEYAPVVGGVQPPPVGTLTARGEHVNYGPRGMPLVVARLQQEVEYLRDQLMYQHELAEASAAKVRQLERESNVVTTTFDNRKHELEHVLEITRKELSQVKADRDQWQQRAVASECRTVELQSERDALDKQLASERATTLSALREYQDRDSSNKERIDQLESEVLRMSTSLKMETTAVNSLKRQLLEFSEIAERNKNTLRDADLDPALAEVMSRANFLFNDQPNPTGEMYAVQKILTHYHHDLRAVFLFYCQLEQNFTDHWPPSMGFTHWMLYCRDSETSDPRAGSRGQRGNIHTRMLQPAECEELFAKFACTDDYAAKQGKQESMLTYESFLCCVCGASAALRRTDVPFLSEALREYILRYLSRAKKVQPQGLGRGQLRSAVEGTRASSAVLVEASKHSHSHADLHSHGPGLLNSKSIASMHADGDNDEGWAKKKRAKPKARPESGNSVRSARPGSALSASPRRMLQEVGNSQVMKELALLSLSGPTTNKEVLRTGGGFALA